MDDENAKEDNQPSKKESQRMMSDQDLYNDRRRDAASNSESFTSGSYSARSRLDLAGVRPEMPKVPSGKREAKPPEKKRRSRRQGRVEKRRRSQGRRTAMRRVQKRKSRKERELSVSTIFTRLSSRSGSRTPGCKFCGHRCCRRRFEYEVRRGAWRVYRRRIKRVARKRVRLIPPRRKETRGSRGIQAGSRCLMLSPLFITSNANPPEEVALQPMDYLEVTPEMIYESLRRLTMWRQYVQTAAILDYIRRNYPVNPNDDDFQHELIHKMRIAAIVGIVMQAAEDYWCLHCALQDRTLGTSHVTKFWQVYGDTMKPIRRQIDNTRKPTSEKQSDTTDQDTSKMAGCSYNL